MIINTLKKYIFYKFSKILINTTLIFFTLGIILNLLEEINFFKDLNVHFLMPLALSFLKVPSEIYNIFPFIFLISSIFLFLSLIQSEEVNVIKVIGISNLRIIMFPTIVSLIFGLFITLGLNTITSKLTHKYLDIKNDFTEKNDFLAALTENGIWIKDVFNKKKNIIRAARLKNNLLEEITIYQFNSNDENIFRIDAKNANISKKEWKLNEVKIYSQNENDKPDTFEKYYFFSNFDVNNLKTLFSDLESVSFWEMKKMKENYINLGYSTKALDSKFQKSLSYPFFLMSMTLLAGVVVMNIRFKGNYIGYIVLSVFLSVIIFYLSDFSRALGETEKISLIMSVWTPVITVFIFSSIGMIYINEK